MMRLLGVMCVIATDCVEGFAPSVAMLRQRRAFAAATRAPALRMCARGGEVDKVYRIVDARMEVEPLQQVVAYLDHVFQSPAAEQNYDPGA